MSTTKASVGTAATGLVLSALGVWALPVLAQPVNPFAPNGTYRSAGTVTSVPADAAACAKDGAVCSVPAGATATVYYGVGSTFAKLTGSGSFTCLPSKLGVPDPAPNVGKTCYASITLAPVVITSVPAGMTACGTDGNKCNVSGDWTGVYGAGSRFVAIKGTGAFTCLPGTLMVDDPVPNVGKTCYVTAAVPAGVVSAIPAGAKPCATDGQTCKATGNWTGVYGANSTFATISGSGPFTCDGDQLKVRDPVPGKMKTCYIAGTFEPPPSAAECKASSSSLPKNCTYIVPGRPGTGFGVRDGVYCPTAGACGCQCTVKGSNCVFENKLIDKPSACPR